MAQVRLAKTIQFGKLTIPAGTPVQIVRAVGVAITVRCGDHILLVVRSWLDDRG